MPSATFQCAASADDAAQGAVGVAAVINATAPNIDDSTYSYAGYRFPSVTIPQGATINTAYLEVVISGSGNDEPELLIYGEDTDNAAQFAATTSNISNRTLTTANVAWSSGNLGAPGTFQSPSLVSVIQEIVDRGGWSSGNAMALIVLANGDTSNDYAPTNYDGSSTDAPKLFVDWTAAAVPPSFPSVSSSIFDSPIFGGVILS